MTRNRCSRIVDPLAVVLLALATTGLNAQAHFNSVPVLMAIGAAFWFLFAIVAATYRTQWILPYVLLGGLQTLRAASIAAQSFLLVTLVALVMAIGVLAVSKLRLGRGSSDASVVGLGAMLVQLPVATE